MFPQNPFSYRAIFRRAVIGLAVSVAASAWTGGVLVASWTYGVSVAALMVYVARGWYLSETGARGLVGLLHVPSYLVWKIGLRLTAPRGAPEEWVRTRREPDHSSTGGGEADR